MLGLRVLTAALGIPVFLAALYLGGPYWAAALILIALASAWESTALFQVPGRFETVTAVVLACVLVASAYIPTGDGASVGLAAAALGVVALAVLSWLLLGAGVRPKGSWRVAAAGIYPGLFLAQLAFLREAGMGATLFAILVTWATDTVAYFAGSAVGKRPLWPSVSPKKTLEGAVAGLLGGAFAGALSAYLLGWSPAAWGGVAFVAALAAELGDLVESRLKRLAGVKDSGRLLPGHGGALDRFDSLLFSGTVVHFFYWLMG